MTLLKKSLFVGSFFSAIAFGIFSEAKPVFPSAFHHENELANSFRSERLDAVISEIHHSLGFQAAVNGTARLGMVVVDLVNDKSGQGVADHFWGGDASLDTHMCGASTLKAPALWAVLQQVREGTLVVNAQGAETPVSLVPSDKITLPNSRTVSLVDLEKAIRPSDNSAAFRLVMSLDQDPARALLNLNQFWWDVGLRSSQGGLFLGSAYNSQGPSQTAPPEVGDVSKTTRQVITPRMLAKYFGLLDSCRLFPTDQTSQVDQKLCAEVKELFRFRNPEEKALVNSTPDRLAKMILTKYATEPRPRLYRKTGSLWGQSLPTCFLDVGIVDRGAQGKYVAILACQESPLSGKACNVANLEKAARYLDDAMDLYFTHR